MRWKREKNTHKVCFIGKRKGIYGMFTSETEVERKEEEGKQQEKAHQSMHVLFGLF